MDTIAPDQVERLIHSNERVAELLEDQSRMLREAEAERLATKHREQRSPQITIGREPLTYEARLVPDRRGHNGLRAVALSDDYSYIADLVAYERMSGDYVSAGARLMRHEQEMKAIRDRRRQIFSHEVSYELEQRAVSWTNGAGGYGAPPLWIVEWFATVPTPERVLSSMAPCFDLPIGAQSVNLPRWTAGADVGVTPVSGATTSTDLLGAAVSSAVTTIAGNADVPLQMLEQSPQGAHLDWAVFTNMESRYGYKLEQQLFTGTGAATPQGSGNNQLLGILNNTSIPAGNIVAYTDATPTVAKMIQTSGQGGPVAQVIAAIGNNRKVKPEIWMMTTSRGAWITSGYVEFPIALSNQSGPGAFDLLAYPAWQNDAIPTTVNTNQDIVVACRPSDWLILESDRKMGVENLARNTGSRDPSAGVGIMTEAISGSLMVRIQMRRYVAALLRQPASVGYLTGTGMVVQSGF